MDLLNKRPLASAILAMLCALYVYGYTESIVAKVVVILASVLFCVFLFVFSHIKRKKLSLHKVIALTVVISLLYIGARLDLMEPTRGYDDEELVITGEVYEYRELSDQTVALTVKTTTVNNERKSLKLLTYAERTDVIHINVGSIVKYSCYLEKFTLDGDFNDNAYYRSEGYDAKTKAEKDITKTGSNANGISMLLSNIKDAVSRRIQNATDSDTGGLLSALLLGDKSMLSSQLRLDFTRLGCSHILALSGMHLAILSAFIEWILSLLRINKIIRKALLIPFIIIYSVITGLPISVVRAGLMLIISCLLFIFAGARDPLTNLFISVGIICVAFPNAIYSTALLLSAFATLGIIALSMLMRRLTSKRRTVKILAPLLGVILASVFAIVATMPVSAVSFDGISVFSILASPFISLICEIYLYIGGFLLIFGRLFPFDLMLKPLYSLLCMITSSLSDIKFSYISVDHTDTKILMILSSLSLFVFMILKVKRKQWIPITVFCLLLSTYLCAICHHVLSSSTDKAIYTTNETGDVLVFNESGRVTVVDTSDYSKDSAYAVYDAVESLGLLHIDRYVLTHYSEDIDKSLDRLVSLIDVDTVYIKKPKCDMDEYFYISINEKLSKIRTEVTEWDEDLYFDDVYINALYNFNTEKDKARIALSINCKSLDLVYLSGGMLEYDTINEATEYTSGADALILGRFGAAYSSICYYGSKYATHDNVYIEGERVALSQRAYERYTRDRKNVYVHKGYYILYVK